MHKVTSPASARATARTWWWRGRSANSSNLARRGNTASIITNTALTLWPSTSTSTERRVARRLSAHAYSIISSALLAGFFRMLIRWTKPIKSVIFCLHQDHDKRRHLSHKFCMTPAGEFKWNGSINGSKVLTISTLRLNIIQLENNVPAPFMHPNWASHRCRSEWVEGVGR